MLGVDIADVVTDASMMASADSATAGIPEIGRLSLTRSDTPVSLGEVAIIRNESDVPCSASVTLCDGNGEDTVDTFKGPADGGRSLETPADDDGSGVAGAATLPGRGRGWPKIVDSEPSLAPLNNAKQTKDDQ